MIIAKKKSMKSTKYNSSKRLWLAAVVVTSILITGACDLNDKLLSDLLGTPTGTAIPKDNSQDTPPPPLPLNPDLEYFSLSLICTTTLTSNPLFGPDRYLDHLSVTIQDSLGNEHQVSTFTDSTSIPDLPEGELTVAVSAFGFHGEVIDTHTQSLSLTKTEEIILPLSLTPTSWVPIKVNSNNFTITWETPDNATPQSYNIFIRPIDATTWNLLGNMNNAASLTYTADITSLNSGMYEVGLSAVYETGGESEKHRSRDTNAVPVTGWVIFKQ